MNQLNDQVLSQPNDLKLKEKRTRRKKHEMDGRVFKCDCMKAYLSQAALNNHKKTKHPELFDNNGEKRKRGRPPLNKVITQPTFDAHYDNFFNDPLRCKIDTGNGNGSGMNIEAIANEVFEKIYIRECTKRYSHYSDVNQNALLNALIIKKPISNGGNIDNGEVLNGNANVNTNGNANVNANGNVNGIEKKKNCDMVLYEYLVLAMEKTNPSYMKLLTTFTALFREFFNLHLHEQKGMLMASEEETAAELPNLCNEFYSGFLEENHFFGLPENEQNEFINLIQHLCYWLYKNKYTQSKLSLA